MVPHRTLAQWTATAVLLAVLLPLGPDSAVAPPSCLTLDRVGRTQTTN